MNISRSDSDIRIVGVCVSMWIMKSNDGNETSQIWANVEMCPRLEWLVVNDTEKRQMHEHHQSDPSDALRAKVQAACAVSCSAELKIGEEIDGSIFSSWLPYYDFTSRS